jgi:hypothetical protein
MANSRKFVQIFLGSPGDLKEERQAAKGVVDTFNKQWAEYFGIQVELVGWEDTVSRYGRPQETINRDLDRCEAFIGVMYRRWGSPPDNDGSFTSGFEEEFERSVASHGRTGRPDISLFFKEIDLELLKDPGDDLKKVLAFKERIISEKKILFETFSTLREFEDRISNCITRYVQRLKTEEAQQLSNETKARSSDDPAGGGSSTATQRDTPLTTEGAHFVREFVNKSERDRPTHPISPVEVARLRLLSAMVGVAGNDESSLGTHDANILFESRATLTLSLREMQSLMESGLDNITRETVPLWHWYNATDAHDSGYLSLHTLFGSQTQRLGALTAMRLIAEPIKPRPPIGEGDSGIERKDFIEFWISSSNERVKIAALEYLAICGITADLPILKAEFERGNYQTTGAAVDAIIRINLRQSREKAIRALFELQPESIETGLIGLLFSKPTSLDTALLSDGAVHRSPKVRAAVVPILAARRALPGDVAERLLDDAEAIVRFEALRSLVRDGREVSEERAKAILVKPARAGLGILSYGASVPDKAGEVQWDRFLKFKLRALSDSALEARRATETIFDQDARLALDFKHFAKRSSALRAAVDGQFRTEFEAAVKEHEQRFGDSETVKKLKSLDEYIRKGLTRKAANLLCEKAKPDDLERIRSLVSGQFVEFSISDVSYLKKHGEWQDISLLVTLVDRRDGTLTLAALELFDDDKLQAIAEAIHAIGKGRFSELCELSMPNRLLTRIIDLASDKEVVGLNGELILKLFNSDSDEVRKAIALKAIKALPKLRLKKLLKSYTEHDGRRYYNVIHWLDLGMSLPKSRVLHAVELVHRKRS